ncbi:MAG: hypothetical protein M3P95_11105 [Actinomycetota bacterium]|nr:hypothetical protein [Actinomycetota bacterium]
MSVRWTGQPIPLLHQLVRAGGVPCDMGRALVGTGSRSGSLPPPRPCPREATRPVLVLDARLVLLLCGEHVAVLSEHLDMPWLGQDQL